MAQVVEIGTDELSAPTKGGARRKESVYDGQLREMLNGRRDRFAILTDATSADKTDNRIQAVIVKRAAKGIGVDIVTTIQTRKADGRFVLVVSKAAPSKDGAANGAAPDANGAAPDPDGAADAPQAAQEAPQAVRSRK